MLLMTRERSLSGHETVQATDYDSFVGQSARPQTVARDITSSSEESLAEKQTPEPKEKIFNSLLPQKQKGQFHPQEYQGQYPYSQANNQLPQSRPRRGSLRLFDLPSEGFKDVLILDNDYFLAVCDDYIKLYSDVGDLLDKLKLGCSPLSLSLFGPNRVVITCYSCRLYIVSIDSDITLSLQLEVETVIQYCSASQLRNDELICVGLDSAELHRLVYRPGLVVLASVMPLSKFDVTVRQDLSYRYVHVTSSGQIVVTDRMNDYVLSLSIRGNWKIPFFYRPQAIVSDESHIYILQGGGLNLAYRFNLDGTNAFCVLRKEHGLSDPWGLSLNRNRKLMVTSNSGNVPGVRVFTGLN